MLLNNSLEFSTSTNNKLISVSFIWAGVALAFITVAGFILNLLVIIFILHDTKHLWTPVNIVLLNLTIADFLMAIFGGSFAMMSALSGGWYWSADMYGVMMSTLGLASIGNLTAMAADRWFLITRPMKPFTTKHATYLSLFVWIYAIGLSVPPLFGFGKFGPEAENISCSVAWESHDPESKIDIYVGLLFIGGFIIPVTIILFSYGSIFLTLRRIKKRVSARRKQEERVTRMITLMIAAFLVGWLPYATAAISSQYFHVTLSSDLSMLPAILAKSSCAYNPVIYACLNPDFTATVNRLFAKHQETPNRIGRRNSTKTLEEITLTQVKL